MTKQEKANKIMEQDIRDLEKYLQLLYNKENKIQCQSKCNNIWWSYDKTIAFIPGPSSSIICKGYVYLNHNATKYPAYSRLPPHTGKNYSFF